eukprot:gene36081-44497_t
MLKQVLPVLCLILPAASAWAQTETPPPAAAAEATAAIEAEAEAVPEKILVVGQKPGPGLWKVSKDGHVLWVFGTYSPLPQKMEWRSQQVESILSQSQEYLTPPGASASVGWLRGLTLLPSLIGVKKNPDGATLKDVLLQYEKPAPAELMEQARAVAAEIDLEFLWEVAGEEEFGFAELGAEYFGHAPLPHEAAGLILGLHNAPIYFYKKGRGRYKKAPEQSLRAALAGIEKKKQQAVIQAQYVEELKANQLPDSMKPIVWQLLFKPDKNTIEYKALEAACNETHQSPQRLMLAAGGIASPKDLHMSKFLFENFPKGAGFPDVAVPSAPANLPLAAVEAFSIDDVTTTEIDDAFSVTHLADGTGQVAHGGHGGGLGHAPTV